MFKPFQFQSRERDKGMSFSKKELEKSFNAGMKYGMDFCLAIDDGGDPTEPDFKIWYQRYISQRK